jgi:hypothetical protein
MNDSDSRGWYRYTARQFNNMLLDKEGFDVYEKYFLKGVDKLSPYYDELSKTMLKLYGKMKERRKEILLGIIITALIMQYPFLRPLKKIAM